MLECSLCVLSYQARKLIGVIPPQPYITKAYFEMDSPPVNLAQIAIGDGTLTSTQASTALPVMSVLETYPQIIGYDSQVFEYFWEQYVEGGGVCVTDMLISRLGVNSAGTISLFNILNRSIFHLWILRSPLGIIQPPLEHTM